MKDILLHLDSYPDPTPLEAVDWAISFSSLMQARLTGLAIKVRIPLHINRVADHLVGLRGMVRDEEEKSATRCQALLREFEVRAKAAGVFEAGLLGGASIYDVGDEIARYARTRDLCILPLVAKGDTPGSVAETVIFESGRPVIVMQPAPQSGAKLDKVVVAWDGSRPAARALADSMPILVVAKEVRILTILDEKESAMPGLGAEPARYLKAHGVDAKPEELSVDGAAIGTVMEQYIKSLPADLLIMGAFGHSRVRQFLLGGATRSMLSGPLVPVLLSH